MFTRRKDNFLNPKTEITDRESPYIAAQNAMNHVSQFQLNQIRSKFSFAVLHDKFGQIENPRNFNCLNYDDRYQWKQSYMQKKSEQLVNQMIESTGTLCSFLS